MSHRVYIAPAALVAALAAERGNLARAGRRLGVTRLVVYRRARDLGLVESARRMRQEGKR